KIINSFLLLLYFLKTFVILFKLTSFCTKKSKLINLSFFLSNVLNNISINRRFSLYPNTVSAFLYSLKLIFLLLSTSNRSKNNHQTNRNPQSPQNSSKLIVPDRSISNMRIIILTVYRSKDNQSPFTRAAQSSFSLRTLKRTLNRRKIR
ncbi:hypothetical protein BDZ45DRAFT_764470, partial [Acephala macrosclerotiorum]